MNSLLLAQYAPSLAAGGVVHLLIVAIVIGVIWYLFNLAPVPPLVKQAVTVIACAALLIYAILFLASFL